MRPRCSKPALKTISAQVSPRASNIELKRDIAYETKSFKKNKISRKVELQL